MESDQIISQLREQINDLQQRDIASCQQIEKLLEENLELHKQAAQASAYKKQIDILLSDPFLVKIRMENEKAENTIEIETDSVYEERNKILIQKLKEISEERDQYAQLSTEQQYYQDQIEKKNRTIVELTEKLSAMTNNADIYKKQLDNQKETLASSESQVEPIKLHSLEESNKHLNEILKEKVEEIGSLTAIKTELEIKNQELTRQYSEAQTMISLQQAENRMITDSTFDKASLARRIQQTCEKAFERAEIEADKLRKRIRDLENKIKDIGPKMAQKGPSEKEIEQEEIIEDLQEQIRYLEENDAAPQLAPALSKIKELEDEIRWLKNKR